MIVKMEISFQFAKPSYIVALCKHSTKKPFFMKVFKTEVFQGHLNKKNYFEGWYFKNVSDDNGNVYAFIPGISLANGYSHAFIQIINGITGDTHYITYDVKDFKWEKDSVWVQIGASTFTDKYIDINIDDKR